MTPPGGGTLENSVPGRCSPAGGQGRGPCLERYEQKHILQEGPPGFSSREVGRSLHMAFSSSAPNVTVIRGETFLPASGEDRARLPTPTTPSSLVSHGSQRGF